MTHGDALWWRREFESACDLVTDLRIVVGHLLAGERLNDRQRGLLDELRAQWGNEPSEDTKETG